MEPRLFSHRSSEMIGKYTPMQPWKKHSKQKQLVMGRQATATRLSKLFIEKLKGGSNG